ncbi:MAG: HIT family protein [Anaerolineae bacterium]|nr:HIT family protein [Anaerolineae bacterium]GIK38012.1 MAG: HIT family protein [Chloroflexota bacterium]
MPGSVADCAFCQIIQGEVPAYIVWEDELSLAFLDRRPLFPGHCLLVPKVHYPTLVDLPADLIGPLFGQAQRLARAVEKGLAAEGTFVAMNNRVSQSVPHLHIHVVPRRKKDGLKGFFWPRQSYESDAAMQEMRQRLRTALAETRPSEGKVDEAIG